MRKQALPVPWFWFPVLIYNVINKEPVQSQVLKVPNIIFSATLSQKGLPQCKTHLRAAFATRYEVLPWQILFWQAFFFFLDLWADWKALWAGKKKLNSHILCVAFKVWGIKGAFVLIDHTPSWVEAWP